ncbi:hypothetical protein VEE34_22760 [Escherichia coli]|nr:hypothetical protein VEE34_22760 [Escherichia coli]
MMNNKVSFTNSNNPTISLSAVIYFPPKFDETRQYQAIVLSHPGGGVKEQTAGTYAKKLAEKGFVTIAYDASGNDSNLLIVFYVQIMPDDFVMQLHRF